MMILSEAIKFWVDEGVLESVESDKPGHRKYLLEVECKRTNAFKLAFWLSGKGCIFRSDAHNYPNHFEIYHPQDANENQCYIDNQMKDRIK